MQIKKKVTVYKMKKLCCIPCNELPEIHTTVTCTCCASSNNTKQCDHEHDINVKEKSCNLCCHKCRESKKKKIESEDESVTK